MGKVVERVKVTNFKDLAENEGAQPLIGQIVLERLDLVIEPSTRKVIPNPRSPETPMIEILATSHNSEDTATVPRKNWQGTFFYPYSVLREGVLITIGYILSPLSWWNDSFVNIPIAYLFGCLFTLISPKLFLPSMIIGYWITNVVGLVLIHKGVSDVLLKTGGKYTKKKLLNSLIISTFYTLLIVVLAYLGILIIPGGIRR